MCICAYETSTDSGIWQKIPLEPDSGNSSYVFVTIIDILKEKIAWKYTNNQLLKKINFNTVRKLFALAIEWKGNDVMNNLYVCYLFSIEKN